MNKRLLLARIEQLRAEIRAREFAHSCINNGSLEIEIGRLTNLLKKHIQEYKGMVGKDEYKLTLN